MGPGKKDIEKRHNVLKLEELSNSYKFVADYYLHQGIVDEDSFEEFINVLKTPLDTTYYVSTYSKHAKRVKLIFKYLLDTLKVEGSFLTYPTSIPWFKDECVWKWKINKDFVADDGSHLELWKFLHQQNACGNIVKQDVLDMLPMLLLNANYSQKVLDMCGHSNQMFYQLGDLLELQDEVEGNGLYVVVDSDIKKCILLSDLTSRYSSPRFTIINVNAKLMPFMSYASRDGSENFLMFDRVMCFLPSSNDGLARNSPETIRGWTWSSSLSYHGTLCETLNSGLGALKIGGRLVFAVNSMNPIENEAVISTVLYQQKGSVHLIDVSDELPDIIYEKCLNKWEVMTNQKWYSKAEDVPEYLWSQVWTTMFPLPHEVIQGQHLERCIRIMPHKQNTSGLFIGVLTRVEYLEDAVLREEQEAKKKSEEEEVSRVKRMEEEARASEEKKKRKQEKKKRKLEMKELKKKMKQDDAMLADNNVSSADNITPNDDNNVLSADNNAPNDDNNAVINITSNDSLIIDINDDDMIIDINEAQSSDGKNKVENAADDSNQDGDKSISSEQVAVVNAGQTTISTIGENTNVVKDGKDNLDDKDGNTMSFEVKKLSDAQEKKADKLESQVEHDFIKENWNAEHVAEAPIVFLNVESPFVTEIKNFYGLSPDFPQHLLYVKMFEGVPFYCYFVSEILNRILRTNLPKHKFVSTGVKVFAYMSQEDADCRFRLTQEGAKYIVPYMRNQLIQATRKDMILILSKSQLELYNLSSSLQNKISRMARGSFVISYEPTPEDHLDGPLLLSCLKTNDVYKCFLSEYQRFFYLRQLGVPFKNYDDSNVTIKDALLNFANHFKNIKA